MDLAYRWQDAKTYEIFKRNAISIEEEVHIKISDSFPQGQCNSYSALIT